MKISIKLHFIEALIIAVVFPLLICSGVRKTETAPFHIDEAHKISETYYFNLFFVKHDFSNTDWQNDFYARVNPPVAKYIMGAFLGAHGQIMTDLSLQQKFEQFWRNPEYLSDQIPQSLLMNARFLSVLFGALTLITIYLIGRLSNNIATGILGSALLACHPFFQYYSTVALTDIILMFFMSSMVLITLLGLKYYWSESSNSRKVYSIKSIIIFLFAAFVIAGAAGTKLNGALAGVLFLSTMFFGFLICSCFSKEKPLIKSLTKFLFLSVGVVTLSTVIFIAINPYIYHNAFSKIVLMLNVYSDWMLKQALDPGQPLWTGIQKFTSIGFFNFTLPQNVFFASDIPFHFMLFFIGLAYCIITFVYSIRQHQMPIWHVVILLWIIVYGFGIGIWIPVTWDRYFFPLAPAIAVIISYGMISCMKSLRGIRTVMHFVKKRDKVFLSKLAGVLASLLLSAILWYGVMDRSLVPPNVFINNYKPEIAIKWYEQAQLKHPDSPLRMINTADIESLCQKPIDASSLYEKAITILENKQPLQTKEKTMLAIAQIRLAEIYYDAARIDASANMLERHIHTLNLIAQSLKTNDPKVNYEFNRTIQERVAFLANIRKTGNP